jgi:hypothetical protein
MVAELDERLAELEAELDWPEAELDADEDEDDDDVLFDSKRGYVEQIDRYKAFQGKPTERRKRNGKP